jgi:Grx4 family monothiol glutaredoxin
LQPVEESLESRIRKLTRSNQTLLFMKGTPEEPRCGLSSKVVRALWDAGVSFGTYNILEDEKVLQGIEAFSNWPTFPQLYHKGELVGGCETVLQLQARGELASTLSDPESCC